MPDRDTKHERPRLRTEPDPLEVGSTPRPSPTPARYRVQRSRLQGSVSVSGAKNSALRLLAASLLTADDVKLTNFPSSLLDAQVHVGMLEALGKRCGVGADSILVEEAGPIEASLIWEGRSIRNTLLILGALTARMGRGSVPLPGGCDLGDRKYDLHVMLLEKLGADVWLEDGRLHAEAAGRLKGADIHLPIRSTGATENAIIAGTLAEGVTRVWNPHIRPEILDLIEFLRGMGARVRVFGQEHIEITGVDALGGAQHRVLSDGMEAITWLVASVMTGGDIEIRNFPFEDLEVPLIHLREAGAAVFRSSDSAIVRGGRCYPVEVSTGPYPGINSDLQPIFAAYGLRARGESRIVDLRFPGRYGYADELARMGASFTRNENLLCVHGGQELVGTTVRALDLRAGIALALAGLVADGETVIMDAWQIERGYDRFVQKLRGLGGSIVSG